ncbi:hypothetical protein INT46_000286 [Mucor plumbeus]|uniref:Uncharacterized protein n=1 Tax=Mucor plumbeus TaxID=97098 RepID=A0A8H7VAE1_9FUNG|nr:hypothetical protein INT46_000286 [Mucor plumbeus]
MEQRTAIVPRDWEDRSYWMKELLDEQESVTQELKQQQVGLIKVDVNSTIRHVLNKFTLN